MAGRGEGPGGARMAAGWGPRCLAPALLVLCLYAAALGAQRLGWRRMGGLRWMDGRSEVEGAWQQLSLDPTRGCVRPPAASSPGPRLIYVEVHPHLGCLWAPLLCCQGHCSDLVGTDPPPDRIWPVPTAHQSPPWAASRWALGRTRLPIQARASEPAGVCWRFSRRASRRGASCSLVRPAARPSPGGLGAAAVLNAALFLVLLLEPTLAT